ncbi:transposable element Tcb2 transposase [Trichonephila clavipes]|nr:transposable element Tcb2 transposase [Trichonephila clavipes]
MMEVGLSARRVARQLSRFDCVGPLCLLEIYEGVWLKNIWDRGPITCAALDAHPSTPPFRVVSRTRKLDAVEWNLVVFSDESRFNLSSDDNRVRVWRPRGECLNLAFALQ